MKKILSIIVLGLLLSGNANAETTITLEKIYPYLTGAIVIIAIIVFFVMASKAWERDKKRKPIKNIEPDDDKMWEENPNEGVLKALFYGNQIVGFIITGLTVGLIFLFFKSIFSFIFLTTLFKIKYIGNITIFKIFLLLVVCAFIYGSITDKRK